MWTTTQYVNDNLTVCERQRYSVWTLTPVCERWPYSAWTTTLQCLNANASMWTITLQYVNDNATVFERKRSVQCVNDKLRSMCTHLMVEDGLDDVLVFLRFRVHRLPVLLGLSHQVDGHLAQTYTRLGLH